jgi:Protein of unknown function (DUF2490)
MPSLLKPARFLHRLLLSIALIPSFLLPATAQSRTDSEFWPVVAAKFQVHGAWRANVDAGLKKGEESEYQQFNGGIGFGRQIKPILRSHIRNMDKDKEHLFVLNAAYERLQTFQSGTRNNENRLSVYGLTSRRVSSRILLSDQNKIEFRWRQSGFSARYRNEPKILFDVLIRQFHFSPYGSAEFFYDGASGSWSREQYSAGVEWPLGHRTGVETYYLRQVNNGTPQNLNVAGLSLNFNFR